MPDPFGEIVGAGRMISVVAPVYNEQENLPELRRRMTAVLDATGLQWELLLVDDGSNDASPRLLDEFHADDPRIKIVSLSRNYGHQPAVTAGIHHASGDCVILIDADLQDPPEVIGQMVELWLAGNEVVIGQRRSRAETGPRGMGLRLFYPLLRRIAALPDGPDAGIFGLMDRVVVDHFDQLPERNRFIPGLRTWLGFRQASVLYDRQIRAAGKPKQSLGKLFSYAMDAMISFSNRPLRLATWMGFMVSAGSFLLAMWYLVTFYAFHKPVSGFTTLVVCILLLGGVQLITIGILGEYIGRIYEEVKQRPLYVVKSTLGLDSKRRQRDSRLRQGMGNGSDGQSAASWQSRD